MAKRIKKKGTKRKRVVENSINECRTVDIEDVGELELIYSDKSAEMARQYMDILHDLRGVREIDVSSPAAYRNDRIVKSYTDMDMPLQDAVESADIFYRRESQTATITAIIIAMLDTNFEIDHVEGGGIHVRMAEEFGDIVIEREDEKESREREDYLRMMGKPNSRARNRSFPLEQKAALADEIARLGGEVFQESIRDMFNAIFQAMSEGDSSEIDENGFRSGDMDPVLAESTNPADEDEEGAAEDTTGV